MAIVNPVTLSGSPPINLRHTIRLIVRDMYEAKLGTSVHEYKQGIWHINSVTNFPALHFTSGPESLVNAEVNTNKDFKMNITLIGYVRAQNPDALDEQLDNFIHAVKRVAYEERDTKFGDTTGLIIDALVGDISVITEFLPVGIGGFEMDLTIHYRTFGIRV